ncbi:cytochrome P450 [Actinomadura sp. B10D3]|uniref:cytochrome P450 n=1 Tax=Actinomadura sp. B10D3 TaxID=3153557 RepID=UPI00325D291A
MTAVQAPPAIDADPFGHEALEDPLPLHSRLRDAGPVTYLTRYDVFALGRYEQVVVRSLLSAGVDTTVHGLAAVLYAFAVNPDQWRRLRENPALARTAFDEAVRWQSPVQTFFRTAVGDREIAGTVVPDGRKILMFLGAANRDPRRWADPDAFDLARDPSGHVGFGMGIHQCVGQHVARLESEALLTALARRVERLEPAADPVRHHNNTLRAWKSLPVRVS